MSAFLVALFLLGVLATMTTAFPTLPEEGNTSFVEDLAIKPGDLEMMTAVPTLPEEGNPTNFEEASAIKLGDLKVPGSDRLLANYYYFRTTLARSSYARSGNGYRLTCSGTSAPYAWKYCQVICPWGTKPYPRYYTGCPSARSGFSIIPWYASYQQRGSFSDSGRTRNYLVQWCRNNAYAGTRTIIANVVCL